MSYKRLEITIISAKGLKRVKHLHSMSVYAVVTLSGNPLSEQRTQADADGGRNPNWNHTMKFTIDEALAQMNYLVLDIKLKRHCTLRSGKEIGEVHVPVKDFLDKAGDNDYCNLVKYMTYQVKKPSGKPKGELILSYKFEDTPVTAYPARVETKTPFPPSVSLSPKMGAGCNCSHPAPTAGHGCPPPTPPAGYPAQASGYGNPPLVQPQQPLHAVNGLGLELGVGLIGGMLGGLLVGEMVFDPADNEAASE